MPKKSEKPLACLVLAAGQGTRMKSESPKVLHNLCGMPMIEHVVRTAQELNPERIYLIVGFKESLVKEHFGDSVAYISQKERLGTGHAVLQAESELSDFDGDVLVLYGDVPLLSEKTLQTLLEKHRKSRAAATLVTTKVADPTGFGRIVRDRSRKIVGIVEEKDATPAQRRKREINPGIYCFKSSALMKALKKVGRSNEQQEYYLTDVIGILVKSHSKVETVTTSDEVEIMQVNDRKQLALMSRIMNDRVLDGLMENGVTVIDPATTFVSGTVEVGRDVTIYPFTHIEGHTRIGEGTTIGPQTYIADCEIEENVVIVMSYLSSSIVRANSRIGPYSHLRPEALIGKSVHIGNFVEVKKSVIEEGSRANHLSYIGDARVGRGVNIGAGTITANYDGEKKHETVIEDGASIGSGTILIAPVKVGKKAVTGAGAVVPRGRDIPPRAIFVGVPAEELKKKKKK